MTGGHTVVFQPSGSRGEIPDGIHLRAAARSLGVEIESVCAEIATCGKCLVLVEDGTRGGVASAPEHLTAMGRAERDFIERRAATWERMGYDAARLRLSCQAKVAGDVVVYVPERSRGDRQIVRKAPTDLPIEVRPTVRWYYLELEPPSLEDPLGDSERVADGLAEAAARVGLSDERAVPGEVTFAFAVLRRMAATLREGDWKVSVAVRNGREVIDIRPGYHDEAYGAAVDLGSTAVALYLCDLESGEVVAAESMMNPQTVFGDDVMTRITHQISDPNGVEALRTGAVDAVNALLGRALGDRDAADVLDVVVAGNTTMHHLLLGLTTRYLGTAPFVPTVQRALDLPADAVGFGINRAADVHLLPIAAGFVGADTTAVLLAEEPHHRDEKRLIIDVGTNAELVLGNRDGLICTSTPTGPAFEGAHIEYGMRAAPGAIEQVTIDPATLEPTYWVIPEPGEEPGLAKGICGSAIIGGVAEMFRAGIIDSHGRFVEGTRSPRVRRGDLGWEYVLALEEETSIGRDIPITIQDVRQVQLAKAALYAAARVLLREAGLERPDEIVLAGAFGARIDPTQALLLGMIPDCPVATIRAVGNAAGDGARIALLNRHRRGEAAEVVSRLQRVELPVDPEFQQEFLAALELPHASHRFTSVAGMLPEG